MCLFCSSLESLEVHKDITDDYNLYRLQSVNITYGDKQVERGKIMVSCTMFVCFFPAKNKCVITRSCTGFDCFHTTNEPLWSPLPKAVKRARMGSVILVSNSVRYTGKCRHEADHNIFPWS